MLVFFNACAHNVPRSVPAFSLQLQQRGQFMHQNTTISKYPLHFFSTE